MVRLDQSWKAVLEEEFKKPYWEELATFIRSEYATGTVYPPPKEVFRAFDLCHFHQVKVVILGQDPYHGAHQANGLAFAVHKDISIPPSLQNIFKEIKNEFGYDPEPNGDLSRWARQGVLLLNATLTVHAGQAGSHQGKGWEEFTNAVVDALSRDRENLVFMLWGNYAKKKGALIDRSKHLVLESAHPSPFSADSGFFGNNHFKLANEYLKRHDEMEIDWH